jgi:tetratricopeptide (TPR) repeat protein
VLGVLGDLAAAERQAEVLAAKLGRRPEPWLELGHAYELCHRYDEALALYDRAAAIAPADPQGPRTGGLRAARWGEAELAEPRLVEALRRRPSDASVWHALGLVRMRLNDLAGAQSAYESGLRADPGALANRLGLATLAVLLDRPEQALVEYDAIVASRPSFADARLGRSWALIRLRRYAEAERAIEQGARLGASPRAVQAQRRLIARLRAAKESN